MDDVRKVADLVSVSKYGRPGYAREMFSAALRLKTHGLIPEVPPMQALKAGCEYLSSNPEGQNSTNQKLFKSMWNEAKKEDRQPLWLYVQLVTRLWLVWPAESIVESMASVAKDVFGTHRRLNHRNAAKELTIRWNGPGLTAADSLICAVNSKYKFNFKRTRPSLAAAFEGTVIARHRSKKCAKSTICRF